MSPQNALSSTHRVHKRFAPSRSTTTGGSGVVKLKIGKGLVDKVLSTGSDGGDNWEVARFKEVAAEVTSTPRILSSHFISELQLKNTKYSVFFFLSSPTLR